MTEHFTGSVERSIWRVTPAEAGVAKIGHLGFFRPELRDTLWPPARTTGCAAYAGQTRTSPPIQSSAANSPSRQSGRG